MSVYLHLMVLLYALGAEGIRCCVMHACMHGSGLCPIRLSLARAHSSFLRLPDTARALLKPFPCLLTIKEFEFVRTGGAHSPRARDRLHSL